MEETGFEKLKRPKIVFSNNLIYISDPPIVWKILLIFLCLFLALIAYESNGDSRVFGVVSALVLTLISIHNSLSLKRVIVDPVEKIIYRKSINPLENLLDRILQHPSRIPFARVEKVYADYTVAFYGTQQYYLYVITDDPYKLSIGTFDKLADAERVASFLTQTIRKAK